MVDKVESAPTRENPDIRERFYQYLMQERALSKPKAHQALVDESIWRHKLAVEQDALLARWQAQRAEEEASELAQSQFLNHFSHHLIHRLAEPAELGAGTPFRPEHFELLDLLMSDNPEPDRILGLMANMTWLGNALLRYMNSPKRRDPRRNVVFNDPRLVFHYLGIEPVQRILPWLIFQHWGMTHDEGVGLRRRKLWRFARQQSEAAEALARRAGLSPQSARVLALLQNLDAVMLLQVGASEFASMKQRWLTQAREEGAKAVHEALLPLQLPGKPLVHLMKRPGHWGMRLLAHWSLADLPLYRALAQLASEPLDPMSRLVTQSQAIAIHQTLLKRRLASEETLAQWLAQHHLSRHRQGHSE